MKEISQDDLSWCRRVAAGVCREFGLSAGRGLDDLTGAGMVGLTMAARRFDPDKATAAGLTFREYATLDVRKRCVAEAVRMIRCGVVGNDAPFVDTSHELYGDHVGARADQQEHNSNIDALYREGQTPLDGYRSTRTSDLRT